MKLENFVVTKFDTSSDDLVEGLPYIMENIETKERQIGVLKSCEPDALAFGTWKGVVIITPTDAKKYNIRKADLTDGMYLLFKGDPVGISASADIPEEKLKEIRDAINHGRDSFLSQNFGAYVQGVINQTNCPPTSSIVCYRIIDYRAETAEGVTMGIEKFYDVRSEETIIKQFLYKVNRVKDNFEDMIQYEICLPISESDKKEYMDEGWKIHPMFYNKENGCYMPSILIKRPVQIMTLPDYVKEKSITLQILTGLQLLHLIEYGPNEKDKEEPGLYAGIDYSNNGIVISNASTDENNRLIIDGEETVLIKPISGYISRFLYWNDKFDWLFFPKETTRNVTMSDSEFIGPTLGAKDIIKWGSIGSESFGIFHYWMRSTDASEDDYIIPWEFCEFGEY